MTTRFGSTQKSVTARFNESAPPKPLNRGRSSRVRQVASEAERQRGYPVDYPKLRALCRQAGLKLVDFYEPGLLPKVVVSEGTIKKWRAGGHASIESLTKVGDILSQRLGWKVSWRELTLTRSAILRPRRIAVLPFRAERDGSRDDSADGFRASILVQLYNIQGLRVRSVAGAAVGAEVDGHLVSALRRSGVQAILGGTVRTHKDAARLDLELADTATRELLWAHSFPFSDEDVLHAQTAIATEVANQIARALGA